MISGVACLDAELKMKHYAAAAAQRRSDVMYGDETRFAGAGEQGMTKVTQEAPPLLRTIDELRRAQDIARDRLEELANRLEPLLAAPAPEPCGSDQVGRPSASPLDSMLMERVGSAQAMDYRIGNLLRRLSI